MPFQSEVAPFVGDDDMADFINDVWLPFARDECNWVDNRAPVPGVHPDTEVWTHRGTVGAPSAPYVFMRTSLRDLFLFTGTGVDTDEEIYDQPGNPANAPHSATFETLGNGASLANMRCTFLGGAAGPYQAYWLFSDTAGRYVHCVLKVHAREYRHFHVGLLNPLHSDLDSEAFYITGHYWSKVAPALYETDPPDGANIEHSPYSGVHRSPFGPQRTANAQSGFAEKQQFCSRYYLPGINPDTDFYIPFSDDSRLMPEVAVKSIGDVNTAYQYGQCNVSGFANGLGAILFSAHRTFTSHMVPLIPIYVSAAIDFEGAARHGVVAQVPDVFRVNMRNFAPEQEITVGLDTYVVFPLINKDNQNVQSGEGYSGYEGLAYKKITAPLE
jgi:hypothetical protein